MNLLLILNYLSHFIISDLYILYSEFKIYNLLYFFNIFICNRLLIQKRINENLKRLFLLAIFFIFYIFCIDLIKNETIIESFKNLLRNYGTISLLPITKYAVENKKFNIFSIIKNLLFISVFFALLQIIGYKYMINDLLNNLPIIQFESAPYDFIAVDRISGANTNYIGFALFVSFLIIFYYYKFTKKNGLKNIIILLFLIIVLLFNQTRAAIYTLLPIIAISDFLITKQNYKIYFKKFFKLILALIPIYFLYNYFSQENLAYIQKKIDFGDTHRLYTNLFMIKGVLLENPLFGINKEESWDIFFKYYNSNIPFDYSKNTPTHHNQIGYYIRYYGLIGLLIFLVLNFRIFQLIKKSLNNEYKIILMSYFFLEFIYSFVHNNLLLNSVLLWSLLSLNFVDKNNKI